MAPKVLPELPAPITELPKYISQHPEEPVAEILRPYRQYEAELRSLFAQDRENTALQDPYVNVLPLFTHDTKSITTRARDLSLESAEEQSKYIMSLPDDKRRANGSPATVADLSEFQKNFSVFSESSLAEMNWDNVVAAGSSVVNCLLPVPDEYKMPRRKLREYYHEKFCPASDVDLFLYGLNPEEAIEKIKQIEQAVRDVLLNEVTVVRTKYAITIASQYPVRHIQIVLRVYGSVSEILTGFDIDAAGGAYDGKQVYVTPRALGSFITQINHIDLTRRSPSYENRLSKYSHRNFEVYWPDLDRSRIDPTIFERSFQRTLGLARLLVLESLPSTSARQEYLNKRRRERGRPAIQQNRFKLGEGNIKDDYEDEVADWLSSEEVSNYHTFSVPYGQRFDAKRIEKLCYTRDLLLNAEWNQNDKREVYLHRHPAFFGRVEDIVEDCCGYCPEPITDEEKEVADKESQTYISGKISFLVDDPGRQQIGSFNPLTEKDWTDMAYIGNTARLCRSIVDGEVDEIRGWTSQLDADVNKRDYTGRSPLHLAIISSTPEVVKCLVESGARITARLADGRTALHLAAARNNAEMIKILLDKSAENEEADADRLEKKRREAKASRTDEDDDTEMREDEEDDLSLSNEDQDLGDAEEEGNDDNDDEGASGNEIDMDEDNDEENEDSDGELIDDEESDDGVPTMTTGSFVKLQRVTDSIDQLALDESDEGPDYYDIDVLAWDVPCSPLHLAIAGGHEDAVKALCDYGADSILPVKFSSQFDNDETVAILTLTLALSLPSKQAISMTKLLLSLGAISSQADSNGATAFHRFVDSGRKDMVDTLLEQDRAGVKMAINHMVMAGSTWDPEAFTPLHSAIKRGDSVIVLKLLNAGAEAEVKFDAWLKAAKTSSRISSELGTFDTNQGMYRKLLQPLFAAVQADNHEAAVTILESGADPNALNAETLELLENESDRRYYTGMSILDTIESRIDKLQSKLKTVERMLNKEKPEKPSGIDEYLDRFTSNTYRHWAASLEVASRIKAYDVAMEAYEEHLKNKNSEDAEDVEYVRGLIKGFTNLREILISRGAKTFAELYSNIKTREESPMSPTPSEEDHAKTFDPVIVFSGDNTITEKRREGYIQLMEAAYAGNLDEIKALTMQAWGPEKDEAPLLASIRDTAGNGPFSLAFFRGHQKVANAILDIVKSQWSPDKKNQKYKMKEEGSDDADSCEDDCDDDDDDDDDASDFEPDIVGEDVDKKYTIDNLGQLTPVKCHITPLKILDDVWEKPIMNGGIPKASKLCTMFQHCIDDNDATRLEILIDIAQHWAGQKLDSDEEDTNGVFTFPESEYKDAIQKGHTELASLIIKRTGAGIPLNSFIKGSGIKLEQKPKFYQGLTVYGKKRKDWASKGRNMITRASGLKTPPLLYAALGGSIESVQFFLSDVPRRLYTEFSKTETALTDPRIQHLSQKDGAFDRAVGKWLGIDGDFIIHCAIVSRPQNRQVELLKYLIKTWPSAIEKKDSRGNTPLMNAALLGRVPFVKVLIEANADQSVRNSSGENIIHLALNNGPKAIEFRSFLELLDKPLLEHLFLQRKSLSEDGSTPLHSWITKVCGSNYELENSDDYYYYGTTEEDLDNEDESTPYKDDKLALTEMLQLLLEFSKGEGLEMFNGAGDTCLHTAVMNRQMAITRALVKFKPDLVHRENAVGRTALEVALDIVTASKLTRPAQIEMLRLDPGDRRPSPEFDDGNATPAASPARHDKSQARVISADELGLSERYSERVMSTISLLVGLGGKPTTTPKELTKKISKAIILDFCMTAANNSPMKRRLVSLQEANDVARRLGEMKARAAKDKKENTKSNESGDEDDNKAPSTEEALSLELENAKYWSNAFDD